LDEKIASNSLSHLSITAVLDGKQRQILTDVLMNQPTTIGDIAKRLSVSESTISRQVARLADSS
jgi:DNA-binding Lrp family transcriptional regulator